MSDAVRSSAASDGVAFDGEAYAACTAHHRAHDAEVLADLDLRDGVHVLDLGCGTGDLTARVAAAVAPSGRVVGLDASPSSVSYARRAHAGCAGWVAGRAQDVGRLLPASSVDVVLSVAVLHWVPRGDLPQLLDGARRVLRPGGLLRVDAGGHGQIAAARQVLDAVSADHGGTASPWTFLDAAEARELLEAAGFGVSRVRLVRQRRAFPDAAACRSWLLSQVLPAYVPHVPAPWREAFRREALNACLSQLRRADGSYDQDYVRLDVLARSDGDRVALQTFPSSYAQLATGLRDLARTLAEARLAPVERVEWSRRLRSAAEAARHDPRAAELRARTLLGLARRLPRA